MNVECCNLIFGEELSEVWVLNIRFVSLAISLESSIHVDVSCPVSTNDFVLRKLGLDSLFDKIVFSIQSNKTTRYDCFVSFIIIIVLFFLFLSRCWWFLIFTIRILNIIRIRNLISFFINDEFLLSHQKDFLSINVCSWVTIKYKTSISTSIFIQLFSHELMNPFLIKSNLNLISYERL